MNSQRDLPLESFKPTVQVWAITNEVTGQYELMGHGYLQISTDEFEEESVHYVEVLKKTQGILLRSRMRLGNNFQRQKGTVITWRDSEQRLHQELAISFQQQKESDFFWYVPVIIARRLICEKIGQNYLDINGRDVLEMPTDNNLTAILEKTKNSKDMVEYHLLNSPEFINSLHRVFRRFQTRNDKMGIGMIGRILRSILTNLDHRLVENMLADPSFELILQVEKFNRGIDLPRLWSERVKIKQLLPLSEQLKAKVQLIHRIAFYRENILDLMKETYFQHILVLTQTECSKDIVSHFIKEGLFEQLIDLPTLPAQLQPAPPKDAPEDETETTQGEVIKRKALVQAKLEFLMEAILTAKQLQSETLKARFLQRLYKSQVLKLAAVVLDQNIPKALDFLHCLVQANPNKFLEYLREKYRESPSDNLHSRLAKKYCLGTQGVQASIVEIIKSLGQCFKAKENLDFFNGTFFTYVFQCCRDERALLVLLSDVQNTIDNVESFFLQAVKSKVLQKVLPFLQNLARDKISQLRALKVLKRILVENGSNRQFKVMFLRRVNAQLINSGYFEYCLMLLSKNIAINNIISSSMLQNLKLISSIDHYTPFHQYIQLNYANADHLQKYLAKILALRPEHEGQATQLPDSHAKELQEERQESYLLEDDKDAPTVQAVDAAALSQIEDLKRIRQEIEEEQQEREMAGSAQIRKVKKENESPMCIEFTLVFDESLEGTE